jgi:drug/metabolite transporter (DMT)-like permease
MVRGVSFALLAGLMWGLIFVSPEIIAEYPAALQASGRYVALGLIAIPLAWLNRARLRSLKRADWLTALKLSAVGNLIYYLCLAAAIQRTGAPVATMIVGTLPVVLPVCANLLYSQHDGALTWRRLLFSLCVVAIGLALVNYSELCGDRPVQGGWRYLSGLALAVAAMVCWAFYALQNARWLRHNPQKNPLMWATAQGLVILPFSLLGYASTCIWLSRHAPAFSLPFGPRPGVFILLMIAIAVLCSWLGALCWNEASQRLPTVILGPLIVFENLAGLLYTFLLRQSWPPLATLLGIAALIAGVTMAVYARPKRTGAKSPSTLKEV